MAGEKEWEIWLNRQRGGGRGSQMDPGEESQSPLQRLRVGGGGGGEGDGDLTSVCFDGDALLFRSYGMLRGSGWSLKDEHFLKEVDVSGCVLSSLRQRIIAPPAKNRRSQIPRHTRKTHAA